MGLTERHWFEDEEPELTENQLEDQLLENSRIFERGYEKGFSDGKSAIIREQEPVKPLWSLGYVRTASCGACKSWLSDHSWKYCPRCGKEVKWNG